MVIRSRVLSESYYLPIFAPDNPLVNICRENARIDRFEVRYPNQRLQYVNPERLRAFVQSLTRAAVGFDALRSNANNNAIKFSKRVILEGKDIYFNHRGGNTSCTFPIVINANYNRFYQANDIIGNSIPDDFRLEQGQDIVLPDGIIALFNADNPDLDEARALALNKTDNLLLRHRWRQASDVLTLLPLQIRLCQQFIENQFDINAAYPLNDAPITNGRVTSEYLRRAQVVPIFDWTNYSIPHLEVCWDFQCRDAIAVAKRYEHPMRQITTHMKTRYHRYQSKTHNNAVSHSARLIENVKLSVYAKTATRLRFEVVYFQRSIKSLFHTDLHDIADIRSIIDFILDDATDKLTRFIRTMHRHNAPDTIDRVEAMTDFVRHIYQSTGGQVTRQQEIMFNRLLSLIGHSGRIIVTQSQERLFPLLEHLEQQGIMERVNRRQGRRSRTYTFTKKYEWLLRAMME